MFFSLEEIPFFVYVILIIMKVVTLYGYLQCSVLPYSFRTLSDRVQFPYKQDMLP